MAQNRYKYIVDNYCPQIDFDSVSEDSQESDVEPPPDEEIRTGQQEYRFSHSFAALYSQGDFSGLYSLAKEFVAIAEAYGRIIITEKNFPNHQKSISALDLGKAGGTKFLVRGFCQLLRSLILKELFLNIALMF